MCGIFALFHSNGVKMLKEELIRAFFEKGARRGPEKSTIEIDVRDNKKIFGFHRLAINGYGNNLSSQPLKINDCVLICNGEIYNWKQLSDQVGITCETGSDCEIIIHLYKKYGMKQTLQMLDGVFAFVLWDTQKAHYFVARDTFGVRPLFMSTFNARFPFPFQIGGTTASVMFASEMKMLYGLCTAMTDENKEYENSQYIDPFELKQFPPGHYAQFSERNYTVTPVCFSSPDSFCEVAPQTTLSNREQFGIYKLIRTGLIDAVAKRVDNTDREIACLLSGGLDSSLITALVVNICKNKYNRDPSTIHTWSIGMKGSEDLRYAQVVADFLGTTHHALELDEKEFLDAIEPVIYAIESDDTTTVRASVGNWLVSKYIKEQSNAKVIFNGDGSDEVCGGYMYFHAAPDPIAFDQECRRLLSDIHFFDVLRSDRSIASHGLEPRTPFLDRQFVQSYLSIPCTIRSHNQQGKCEKYLLRRAFAHHIPKLLPEQVLWRTKEAFSDGVSQLTRSWFEIIQDHAVKLYPTLSKSAAEKKYYNNIYRHYYGDTPCTPYKWMPKFVDATDSSARTLKIYKTKMKP